MFSNDPRLGVAFVVAVICLGSLVMFVLVPILVRATTLLEVGSVIVEFIGESTGNPRLAFFGCLVVGLILAGCCVISLAVIGALLTCSTANPSQLCRLVAR